jgi:hypothetical protein
MKNVLVAAAVSLFSVFSVSAQWTAPATASGTTPIHYDGNVGVGTGTATPAYPLDVNANVNTPLRISGNTNPGIVIANAGTAKFMLGIPTAASNFIWGSEVNDVTFRADGGGKLLFSTSPTGATNDLTVSAGKVGIGTFSPNFPLDVSANTITPLRITGNDNPGIVIANSGAAKFTLGLPTANGNFINGSTVNDVTFRADGGGKLLFSTAAAGATNDLAMAAGNIGIGTSSPNYPLDIIANVTTPLRVSGNTNPGIVIANAGAPKFMLGIPTVANNFITGSAVNDVTFRADGGGRFLFSTSTTGVTTDLALSGGSLGIGTSAPLARLQVAGDLRLGSNGTNTDLRVFSDSPATLDGVSYNQINTITPVTVPSSGVVTRTALFLKSATASGQGTNQIDLVVDGNIAAKYQDVAEWVPATIKMAPGTVVILNSSRRNEVMPSIRAYDTAVAGVVSAQPGLILGEAGDSKARIATTGRVKVRVDATTRPINIGDLLVTSDRPGMAMLSEPLDLGAVKIHRPGTLIGKALEPLASGQGEILVLLSLQ